jgi:hypothetical protein
VRAKQHPPVGKSGAGHDQRRASGGAVTIAPCPTMPLRHLPQLTPPPATSLARARCAPATSTRAPAASPTKPPPGKRPRCCGRCGPRCPRGKPRRWPRRSWPRSLFRKRPRSLRGIGSVPGARMAAHSAAAEGAAVPRLGLGVAGVQPSASGSAERLPSARLWSASAQWARPIPASTPEELVGQPPRPGCRPGRSAAAVRGRRRRPPAWRRCGPARAG